jgi:hypothetical protein
MSPVPGTDANPLRVDSDSNSKGYQQVTSTTAAATLASLCTNGVLPAGATRVLLVPTAQIRIRDDGTAPTATVGYPIAASAEWKYDGNSLAALRVINAATIDCWFFA